MNNKKPDNPPAFPSQELDLARSNTEVGFAIYKNVPGATLRDYFAAKAMQGYVSTYPKRTPYSDIIDHAELISYMAYQVADAMLIERQKQQP